MNQLVENFSNFPLARSYCEHVGNFVTSICSKYGADAMTAAFYGIIGCISIGIIYFSKRRPRPTSIKPSCHLQCLSGIHGGGDRMLHRLDQINEAKANPAVLANTQKLLTALLEEEHLDFKKLQQTVAKLEMSGSEDSAVKMLEGAYRARYDRPHEAYEIEMLLVEMHIFKGVQNDEILNRDCLKHESIKDERRPLYKAIIQKMLQDTEKAKEYWKEFVRARDPCLYGARHETDFKEFEKVVDKLQHAIKQFPGK